MEGYFVCEDCKLIYINPKIKCDKCYGRVNYRSMYVHEPKTKNFIIEK